MSKFGISTQPFMSVIFRYGLAVLSVAAALFIRELVRTYFEPTPNSFFFCAIALSSWLGGFGPGLVASLLSVALIDYHFAAPYTVKMSAEDLPRVIVFFVTAASISWLSASQERARKSLQQAHDELEIKVQERTAELRGINKELRAEITERKSAEAALLSSEAQLKEAQAVAHLGSYEVDVLTGQTRWSDEVFRILGLDPANGSLSRRDFIEHVIHPEDREYATQRYNEVIHEGKLYDLECRVVRPDGSVRFVQSMGEAIKSQDGIIVRLVGALLDITERKHSEDKLARLNRTLQTLYQCNQALIHATEEYELLQAVCRILVQVGGLRMAWVGYRELDAAKTIRPVAQAGYDQGYVESVKATWATTERGQGPTGTAIRTGKPSWTKNIRTDSSIAPWREEALKRGYYSNISLPLMSDGDAFGAFTLYAEEPHAFNERAVEQFTELANNLAFGVIALRTREERKRAEDALQKAQVELAHVTRVMTLGEMTASIAHEINQPLAAVANNAGACLRWLSGQAPNLEEARQSAELIIGDAHRAGEIIRRIRALAKKSPPRKDCLNINETILEVIALARSEIERNRVSLQTRLSSDVPLILGDRIQLQQVILNLIINAVEAMGGTSDGPRELVVSSKKNDLQDLLVAVRDSGPGLDPNSLDHLFTAFFTTKPKGMGMGLAISRSIIEAHGGRLWATPNNGQGATFQFTLPMGKKEAPSIV
jgi:PAS domain S-box-containing protein